MSIRKQDVICIELNQQEVRYCNRVACDRTASAKPSEAMDVYAQEFCVYAVSKMLLGLTAHSWAAWLMRRVANPETDLPPSNVRIHGRQFMAGKKLSEHAITTEALSQESLSAMHVFALAKFSMEDSTATVYIIGWLGGSDVVAAHYLLSVSTLLPMPHIKWDWARDISWQFTDEEVHKNATSSTNNAVGNAAPREGS